MQLTLRQIMASEAALNILVQTDMKAKGKYWVAKQAKKIQGEIENIKTRRDELIKKYGVEDKDGNFSVKEPKKVKKFNDEYKDMLDEITDIDIQVVKYEHVEELTLAPAVLMDLDYLIGEPEGDEPAKE